MFDIKFFKLRAMIREQKANFISQDFVKAVILLMMMIMEY
jgi:hypothetical protein